MPGDFSKDQLAKESFCGCGVPEKIGDQVVLVHDISRNSLRVWFFSLGALPVVPRTHRRGRTTHPTAFSIFRTRKETDMLGVIYNLQYQKPVSVYLFSSPTIPCLGSRAKCASLPPGGANAIDLWGCFGVK